MSNFDLIILVVIGMIMLCWFCFLYNVSKDSDEDD